MNTRFPRKKAMEPRRDEADLGSDIRVFFTFKENVMQITKNTPVTKQKHDEIVFVVKRSTILQEPWQGFKSENLDLCLKNIYENREFLLRPLMELDENYKQIVSYMIFKFEDKIFLMQRKSSASEQRLKNKLSIGIGGHIKQEDVLSDSIDFFQNRSFDTSDILYQNDGHSGRAVLGGSATSFERDLIFDWCKREFQEEINYAGNIKHKLIGLINDDSNSVGRVHMGLVFLL